MRRIYLFVAFVTMVCGTSYAQEFRVNGYTGYTFDDAIDSYYSNTDYFNGTIKGTFRWGGGLEYILRDRYGVELLYLRQDTKAPVRYYDRGEKQTNLDLAANWIMLGGTNYMKVNDIVEPYGGIQAGAVVYNIKNPAQNGSYTGTKFAWGLKLGTNLFFSRTVGIKLQADLLSAVQAVGGGLYFGTGGAGTAVSTYSTILQFNLGGGLVFRFKPKPVSQAPRSVF